MRLAEFGSLVPPDGPLAPPLNEVRNNTNYILHVSHCAALSLGRGMAPTGVAQRHLWLTLSDDPKRDRAVYMDELVSADGLFGHSLKAIQAMLELQKKDTEALRSIIPALPSRHSVGPAIRSPEGPIA